MNSTRASRSGTSPTGWTPPETQVVPAAADVGGGLDQSGRESLGVSLGGPAFISIRHEGKLSLINPIRLSPQGEAELGALGKVENIIRLGPMHGVDDPYYVDRFHARLWCQPGGTSYPEPAINVEMNADGSLPFPDAELFCFEGTIQPESALLLKRGAGLLLSCDAIQHYGDYRFNNLPARLIMPLIGFPRTTIIGPFWLKLMTPEGRSLKTEFERLLSLDFDAFLSGHGSFLDTGARAAVQRAFEKTYGQAG